MKRRSVLALPLAAAAPPALLAAAMPHRVVELRQYKVVSGRRDRMIALFDRWFVESQEALGARIIGQFRVPDDPDRFVWLREFPDMKRRAEILNAFYYGPVWQAHRGEANPLLDDNDNVLLLHAATPALDFAAAQGTRVAPERSAEPGAASPTLVVVIHYLWKPAAERFLPVFLDKLKPALAAADVAVLAGFVPEEAPNDFPRLPVRQGERLFVWFARETTAGSVQRALEALRPELCDLEERPAQRLDLAPTARSLLR